MENQYLGWTINTDNTPMNVCIYNQLEDGKYDVCGLGWDDKPFQTDLVFFSKEDCIDHLLLSEEA